MPDAIIFDMDDTLIISQYTTQAILESAIARFDGGTGGPDVPTVIKAIMAASDWYWADLSRQRAGRLNLVKTRREICRMAFESLGRTDFALAEKIADEYSAKWDSGGVMASGTLAMLAGLRERGLKLAMITNGASDVQRAKINKCGLEPYFDNILIEGEFGTGKPDAQVFLHTLEQLGVKASEVWMVGDDIRNDIAPCRALGIYSLWVNGSDDGQKIEGIQPDKTIKSIAEIPGLL